VIREKENTFLSSKTLLKSKKQKYVAVPFCLTSSLVVLCSKIVTLQVVKKMYKS